MDSERMTLRLTEEQSQQIRWLTGQETSELKLVVMSGPEPLLLAWAVPNEPGAEASHTRTGTVVH